MKYRMFSVLDKKVQAYLPPFVARTNAEGIRMFERWCGVNEMPFKHHPDDFDLYEIGEWDDETAFMHWEDQKSLNKLSSAREFVPNKPTGA